ncbi:LysE family translocator [Allopusillimonas ginsengisoli]|uniref:LysE family translocator n=1 Tax=Allopusillimonas ginsengisoli TaxID=453575 RepID=UPI00101E8A98|nr:LysE family translocator [Allopusillimonas ginsengisoli]TEA77423.1 LysE family translocator [Allopusillimonas ginsengisoli]
MASFVHGLPAWLPVPLILFAFATSITPGPNNIMLASSGLTFGFRRTVPHILGVTLGFTLLLVLAGLGLGSVFQQFPWLYTALKYVGTAYLLYLAWRVATAGPVDQQQMRGRPLTFMQAALFQWVNPKAWVMVIGVIAAYTPQHNYYRNLAIAALACCLVNLPSVSVWAAFGASLQRLLRAPTAVRLFNLCMGLLLVASLYPVALELVHQW